MLGVEALYIHHCHHALHEVGAGRDYLGPVLHDGMLQSLQHGGKIGASDGIVIDNGTGPNISHIGSSTLCTPTISFFLYVLCISSIQQNLTLVSLVCHSDKTFVEFFLHFLL